MEKPLVLELRELPKTVVLIGRNGQREVYQLVPASRKFGAALQKIVGQVRESVLLAIDRNW